MSGYRQHSYEPNRWNPQGPPVRPYNWVQWTGVAFVFLGLGIFLVYAAGRAGWIPRLIDDPMLVTSISMIGMVMITSRRQPVSEEQLPELRRKRRRTAAIALIVALVAAAIGFAAAYLSKGA
jgi:multisubunit Na+/H+ antiporter MnhB subunit